MKIEKPDLYDIHEQLTRLKEEGKKIVGVIAHSIVPDEIIHAADCIPLHFCLGGTEEQMVLGQTYLSQTTCGFQRVNLGIFEGREEISYQIYELMDFVIAGTFCNGVQNTGMYLDNYFDKEQYQFIIPHGSKPNSFEFFHGEIIKLKKYLEKKTNIKISNRKLIESIQLYNELRTVYQEIDKYRQGENPKISLGEIQKLIHHLNLNGPDLNLKKVMEFLDAVKRSELPPKKGVRIFLTGNGILIEDNFVQIVEDSGCIIVGDDLWTGFEFYSSPVNVDFSNPLDALADRYLNRNLSGRMIPDSYRTEKMLEIYKKRNIKGIINNYLKFCDSFSNSADYFKQKMKKKNIPVLNLERDYSQNSIGQIRTRLEAFLEML